ncbi:hypothetical protein Syun_001857 [Stephania yunnanensis]|uniref:Uncharacterized protein n=1 Tax=Stephania yunnanensis TaxID=152371 RepID=A0AAP0Q6Q0_9MAGN
MVVLRVSSPETRVEEVKFEENATVLCEQVVAFRLAKDLTKAKLAFEKASNVTGLCT